MKKILLIYLLVVFGLIFPMSAAYAWCWPWCGCWVDYGKSKAAPQEETVQRETLDLKDQLSKNNLELLFEYSQPNPDPERIATLRQKIMDLEKKISTQEHSRAPRAKSHPEEP